MSEVKIVVYFKKQTIYPAYPAYKGQEYWNFEEKLSQDQIERGEKGWEVVIDKKHSCFNSVYLRVKTSEEYSIYKITFDKNAIHPQGWNSEKRKWFDKNMSIKIDDTEREREREREREQNWGITRTNCWIGGYN